MVLFGLLKKGINETATRIKISILLKVKYLPFFSKKEKLAELKIVSEIIDKEISKIYYELKRTNSNKYANEIRLYEEYRHEITFHNQEVNFIINEVGKFHYSEYLDNPSFYSETQIDSFYKVSKVIQKFRYREKKFDDYCKQIDDIKKNHLLILKQYILKQQLDEWIGMLNGTTYVSIMCAEMIKNPILQLTNIHQKLYYNFSIIKEIDELVWQNNRKYIDSHLNKIEPIDGRVLDNDQKEAILKDEKSLLVIAGAGSGKTLTLVGKVKYLLDVEQVKPDDILVLSYSKATVEDLKRKIGSIYSRITIKTFHSLGYEILMNFENKKLMVEDQFNSIIEMYFREELEKDKEALEDIIKYFAFYFSPYQERIYQNKGEMYEEMKSVKYQTLKSLVELSDHPEKRETLKKEIVKSHQEMVIANFYFIHGIDYCYEDPYQKSTASKLKRQYMPDFHLVQYDIYHEHYGVNSEGKACQFENEEEQKEYLDAMEWKRQEHNKNNTVCIETFSYEFEDGTIFENLERQLRECGVQIKEIDEKRIFEALHSIYGGINFRSFIKLVISFLNLYKSKFQNEKGFTTLLNKRFENDYTKKRTELFLKIAKRIYIFYMNKLKEKGKIDFDVMILKSIQKLPNVEKFTFKYILVDEFQDMTNSRKNFLRALIEKGNAHLFAVGDDWQSIYRFNGSDISIFTNFKSCFDYAEVSYIQQTHRNSQELQNIAGDFIKKNKGQSQRTIISKKEMRNPIKIIFYDHDKEIRLQQILRLIYEQDNNASVLILGRNNSDIIYFKSIIQKRDIFNENNQWISYKYPSLNIKFSTVHGAKGLEDDYVILINADDGLLGFPNKIEDDDVLQLLLPVSDHYDYSEERRLWYVALTRTRKYVYILSSRLNPSVFVNEIKEFCEILNVEESDNTPDIISCPWCKTGKLVFKSKGDFYGCSNYPYCHYQINSITIQEGKRCKKCGDFLVIRKNKNGKKFYGCHNFPLCKYTEEFIK